MTTVAEQLSLYESHFEQWRSRNGHSAAAWLMPAREQALQRFLDLGFPTTKHEDWRFTNLRSLASAPFALNEPRCAGVSRAAIAPFDLGATGAVQLIFVNGRLCPQLSTRPAMPRGVRVGSLAQALHGRGDLLQAHLTVYADDPDDAFTALNTAFIEDGGLVHVGRGVKLERPIHLLFVSTGKEQPQVSHCRTLVVAEPESEATVIEHYVDAGGGAYWSNAVTEVVVGPNANVTHYLLEEESEEAFNVSSLRVHQHRNSRFTSHAALFGGRLVRNNVHVELAGEGCDSLVNGLFMGHGEQHLDNHMRVVHAEPHGDSRQFYKGILDDKARGVFSGRIVVRPDAQKTDAKQSNRNLLLTDDARTNTKPQLEIFADDVKCTHGATTGQLDENAVFYLQARGLSKEAARAMLIYAFARENLDRMAIEPVRDRLERLLVQRLSRAELPEVLNQAPSAISYDI